MVYLSSAAAVKALRRACGPLARSKRVTRHGCEGVQLLDGDGRVLLQTFETTDAARALGMFLGAT